MRVPRISHEVEKNTYPLGSNNIEWNQHNFMLRKYFSFSPQPNCENELSMELEISIDSS